MMTNKQTKPVSLFLSSVITANPQCQLQTGKATSTAHKNKFNGFFFLFFILVDLIIRVFHTLTYFLTISWGIFLFPLLLFQAYEKGKLRNEGEKIMKVYCAHTEQLWNKLFSFNITNLKACAKRKLRKAMLPQQFWSASELPPRKGVSDVT